MKVPWFIVILSALLVFGGVLYLGSRNHDFTANPSAEDLQVTAQAWQDSHPPLPQRDTPLPIITSDNSTENPPDSVDATPTAKLIEQQSDNVVEVPHQHNLDEEDLVTRPALDHFTNRSSDGKRLFALAKQLDAQGHYAFALLAYERLLDSSDTVEHADIIPAIQRLRAEVEPWNIDPELTRSFTLHCSIPESYRDSFEPILKSLPELIAGSSSFIVFPTLKTLSIKEREGFPTPPVSMWCSLGSYETPRLSFQIKSPSSATPTDDITAGELQQKVHYCLYQLVQQTVVNQSNQIVPAELIAPTTATTALKLQITRWSWSTFIQILAGDYSKPLEDPDTEEEVTQSPPRAVPVSE